MASYRKMRKYVKTKERYKLERARRKKVLALYQEGHSQKDIALRLGVSTKTINRDMQKLHSYLEKLKWEERRKTEALLHDCMERIPRDMRFQLVAAMWAAEGRQQARWFSAFLKGDVAKLKLMLSRRSNK